MGAEMDEGASVSTAIRKSPSCSEGDGRSKRSSSDVLDVVAAAAPARGNREEMPLAPCGSSEHSSTKVYTAETGGNSCIGLDVSGSTSSLLSTAKNSGGANAGEGGVASRSANELLTSRIAGDNAETPGVDKGERTDRASPSVSFSALEDGYHNRLTCAICNAGAELRPVTLTGGSGRGSKFARSPRQGDSSLAQPAVATTPPPPPPQQQQ